jgi:hypothetical protein
MAECQAVRHSHKYHLPKRQDRRKLYSFYSMRIRRKQMLRTPLSRNLFKSQIKRDVIQSALQCALETNTSNNGWMPSRWFTSYIANQHGIKPIDRQTQCTKSDCCFCSISEYKWYYHRYPYLAPSK